MQIPTATYRIQFSPDFRFESARRRLPYLSSLGISDIYASPVLSAMPGSSHGYDVVDPQMINPELGGMTAFERITEEAAALGMGWLQDIVPNHMSFSSLNLALMDVLENGDCSRYYRFFDITWVNRYEGLRGRLLAPFLGRYYAEALEDGEIQLCFGSEGFSVAYFDHSFPLRLETYPDILTHNQDALSLTLGEEHTDHIAFLGILYILKSLPCDPGGRDERYNQIHFVKQMLWELYTRNKHVRAFIDGNIAAFNGERGKPESYNLLDALLTSQLFRLSFWKVATEELNYRRFFTINGLISLRIEDEEVFNYAHDFILSLMERNLITGLRIDHIDGLYDPAAYLNRLRSLVGDHYVVVEKILDMCGETLPHWPVEGATGYEFLNHVNGLFIRTGNAARFDAIYTRFTGVRDPYDRIVSDRKRLIIGKHLAGDIDNLAHIMKDVAGRNRYGNDLTLYGLKRTLVEIMAQFPVYRTYAGQEGLRDEDRRHIDIAVNRATHSNPGLANELAFVRRFLLLEFDEHITVEEKERWLHFVMKFQQITGPLMAKGFEDTTFYVYNRFVSLNEVGGSPDLFGIPAARFHRFMTMRAHSHPHSMNATATHDTKRGEDVRARLDVLSEIPREWQAAVTAWSRMNAPFKTRSGRMLFPDRNDEYLLYQTLVGAWPFGRVNHAAFIERLNAYLNKAVREAKEHTAWLKPDSAYEDAFRSFAERILEPDGQFMASFLSLQKRVAWHGVFNSLAQTLIKITAPGVPDFYQGTELWDFSLVDPDNRRPVDYARRVKLLAKIAIHEDGDSGDLAAKLIGAPEDGSVKLFLIRAALSHRTRHADLYRDGAYQPLRIRGRRRTNIVAYARTAGTVWTITAVPRFTTMLTTSPTLPLGESVWEDASIELPEHAPRLWRNEFTGEILNCEKTIPAGETFARFPVALLTSKEV